jgi:hypothetical protein
MQFIERYDEIAAISNSTRLNDNCDAWTTFTSETSIEQDDSGV